MTTIRGRQLIETEILFRLDNPGITKGLKILKDQELGYGILMERRTGTLLDLVERYQTMDQSEKEKLAYRFLYQLSSALKCLVEMGYLHVDLHYKNICYDEKDGEINFYLIDFGETQRITSEKDKTESIMILDAYGPGDSSDDSRMMTWILGVIYLSFFHGFKENLNWQCTYGANPTEYPQRVKDVNEFLDQHEIMYPCLIRPIFSGPEKLEADYPSRFFRLVEMYNVEKIPDVCSSNNPEVIEEVFQLPEEIALDLKQKFMKYHNGLRDLWRLTLLISLVYRAKISTLKEYQEIAILHRLYVDRGLDDEDEPEIELDKGISYLERLDFIVGYNPLYTTGYKFIIQVLLGLMNNNVLDFRGLSENTTKFVKNSPPIYFYQDIMNATDQKVVKELIVHEMKTNLAKYLQISITYNLEFALDNIIAKLSLLRSFISTHKSEAETLKFYLYD